MSLSGLFCLEPFSQFAAHMEKLFSIGMFRNDFYSGRRHPGQLWSVSWINVSHSLQNADLQLGQEDVDSSLHDLQIEPVLSTKGGMGKR